MGQRFTDLGFDEWVKHVFDHAVTDPEWHFDAYADDWAGTPIVTTRYVTRLFENAEEPLRPFSDAQVNQGLWYMASNCCSSIMVDVLEDPTVPWPELRRCICSIRSLFERCFAKRCSNHLSHLGEPGANPINGVCYMWWDVFPALGANDDPSKRERDQAILDVMRDTIELPCDACRESALHGLGHWHGSYPDAVVPIIDDFLRRFPEIRDQLRTYAFGAMEGYVL